MQSSHFVVRVLPVSSVGRGGASEREAERDGTERVLAGRREVHAGLSDDFEAIVAVPVFARGAHGRLGVTAVRRRAAEPGGLRDEHTLNPSGPTQEHLRSTAEAIHERAGARALAEVAGIGFVRSHVAIAGDLDGAEERRVRERRRAEDGPGAVRRDVVGDRRVADVRTDVATRERGRAGDDELVLGVQEWVVLTAAGSERDRDDEWGE